MAKLHMHGVIGKRPIEGWSQEAQALFNAMTTEPSLEVKGYIDDFITALKSGGVWSKLDLAYLFAVHTNGGSEALINIVDPGTFDATIVNNGGSLSFTAYQGFTGDGNAYISTGFNLSTDTSNYVLNSAAAGVYLSLDKDEYTVAFGATDGTNQTMFIPKDSGSNPFRLNSSAFESITGTLASIGFHVITRSTSTTVNYYRDASLIGSQSLTSTALPNDILEVLARGAGNISTNQVRFFFVSSNLTSANITTINNALNTYMTNVSVGGWDSDAQAIFDAMTTEPDNTHKGYINTLVTTLKDNSIWAKIDIAYLLAAHTNANDEALINIVNPGTFDGVEVPNGGSLTFTQYEGFASDGNAYINTSYNPSTDATNFALNSGAIGVYSRSDIFEARYEFGGHTNGASIDGSVIALTNDNFYGSINCADITGTSLDSTQGMYVASRLSSGDVDLYRNGSKVKDDTTSSGSLFNGDLYLCNRNVNGSPGTPSTKQLSFAFISSGLTLSEVSTLSEAVNEYMTSLGKNVYSGSGNPLLPPPSYITVNSTFENISIHLDLTSLGQTDSDLDSTFVIEYKEAVSLGPYLPSAPVARCHTGYTIDGSATTYNFWAGSCMHLNPDTEYEVKTTYYDPDEGSAVIDIFSASTQAYPTTPTTQKYCIPGTSGGDGSSGNPWQGLQTAVDNASAGDNIECANGTYDDISITSLSGTKANPIRFYAANARQAIIDANASIYGIQINPSSGTIDYIEFDGFEIRDATSGGIGIHECNFISIKNCYIWDVPNGIRARGWDNDNINHTYIYNNKIIGNTTWPRTDGGWGPDKGVWTSGNNETICYNEISNFDDGISWESQNFDEVNYGADIHHNYVHKIVDDAVEIDESVSNVRVYKNYIYDARDGVSTGPLHGGPCYVFRNVIYNMETSGHKLTRGGTGVYMYNNTECMLGYGHVNSSSSKSTWNNTITKNMAGFSQFDFYAQFGSLPDSTDHDWNYNFFYSSTYSVRYIWNNTAYTTAASLYSAHGLAQNDGTITFSDVTTGSLPTDDYDAHSPGSYDWRPTSGSGLIGAGIKINNVNDPWDSANPPTAGAFVYNETLDSVGCNF